MPAASPANIRTAAHLIAAGLDPAASMEARLSRAMAALRACRAFIADLQHAADPDAAALLRQVDIALEHQS